VAVSVGAWASAPLLPPAPPLPVPPVAVPDCVLVWPPVADAPAAPPDADVALVPPCPLLPPVAVVAPELPPLALAAGPLLDEQAHASAAPTRQKTRL
jgi:hypothetical protein